LKYTHDYTFLEIIDLTKTYYNKLVRDKIPDIISSEFKISKTRTLNDEEFKRSLTRKLMEEVIEFISTPNIEELADIIEVIHSLADSLNSNIDEVETIRLSKKINRGGFDNRLFLEYVEVN